MASSSEIDKICPACGTKFNIIYYQRRAADEPPDKVVYCSECPLDTNKLSFALASKLPIQPTKKTIELKSKSTAHCKSNFSNALSKTNTRTYVIVKGNAAIRCYKSIKDSIISPESIVAIPISITTDTKSVPSYYYLDSCTEHEAHITKHSHIIAPFVVQKIIDIYTLSGKSNQPIDESNKCVIGYEYRLPAIDNSIYIVLRTLHDSQQPYIFISLTSESLQCTLSVLEQILTKYGTELSIKSIMDTTMINNLYRLSGRAYDYPSAPDDGHHSYTWKPDGERFWYIKYGSIWLFSRRLLSGRIAGWNICKSINTLVNIGPVLDIELMIGFPPILIDILISDNGQSMPIVHSLDEVLDEFKFITDNGTIDTPIHVRNYYRSDKEVLSTKNALEYPVDGVVGIEDGTMNIIKLKDDKSIELELTDNGDLITSDKYVVANSNLQNTEDIGSIIEIRFSKQSASDICTIKEIFARTDKAKANDLEACKSIMNSISDTPDSLARRTTVQWCSSVRLKLNKIASKTTGKGRVIVDIGAGDGQAVSEYSTDPEVTYLLLEPNPVKCKNMLRRLRDVDKNNARLFEQASDVINALRLLITKKIKYAVLCATLRSILQEKECIRTLKTCVRCCIASLSISYIAVELQQLAIEGLNVIGFGYMYDSVNKKGELINEHGVLMKYKSYQQNKHSADAIVQWGTDKVYIEPAITLKDFKEVFYYKLAKNIVPIVNDSKVSLLNTVGNSVYIISNDKYIV